MTPKPLPIVLYCYRTDGSFRMITAHYADLWQARRFLEVLLNADPFVWEEKRMTSDPQLMTGRGIRVRGAQLEQIMAYDYSNDTRDLQLPDAEVRRARQIMTALPDPDEVHEAIAQARQERREKLQRPKVDREGKVTIGEIAEELDMEPREARAILRSLKIEKPLGGWLFDPTEVEVIKQHLTDNRG